MFKDTTMNSRRERRSRLLGLGACVSLLGTVLTSSITPEQATPASSASACATRMSTSTLEPGMPAPCIPRSQPLTPPDQLTNFAGVPRGTARPSKLDPVDLRVLVISADGTEADLPAIKQALDYLGVPFTVYVASQTPGGLTPDKLSSGVHGYYEGVILTTGALASSGTTQSALNSTEWQNLSNYEATFHIRQVTWYTFPTADYGFSVPPTGPAVQDTTSNPLNATFTAPTTANANNNGQALFGSYVNTSHPLKIQDATAYLAPPLSNLTTFPLLVDANGNALALIHNYNDANGHPLRQNLALTFDSNAFLIHDLVLAYGLVNWVTKGLFLGERHVFLGPQVDDVLIDNSTWPPTTPCATSVDSSALPTYRITDSDLGAFVTWQQTMQKAPTTAQLRTTLPFNGVGSTGVYANDTLTPAVKTDQNQFNWVSHTYDHENLDNVTYGTATTEIQQNNQAAQNLGFGTYSPQNMVTPDVSGLTNTNFLQAAHDNGIRYLVTDTSRPGYNNPSPNAGIYNQFQPSILMIPRYPTNLYFNVGTPQQWLAEDNCLYPAGAFGHVTSYPALLDRQSQVLLLNMLQGDMDPLMFHQTNMEAYDGTHSLLSDLLDATLAKYNSLFTLPVLSPPMGGSANSLGDRMAQRMQYNSVISSTPAPASLELGPNGFQAGQPFTLTITAPSPLPPPQTLSAQQTLSPTLTVPVTGLNMSGAERYGGQYIAHITLKPGQSCTVTGTIPASDGTVAQPSATVCATPAATATPTATAKPAATATAKPAATATAKPAASATAQPGAIATAQPAASTASQQTATATAQQKANGATTTAAGPATTGRAPARLTITLKPVTAQVGTTVTVRGQGFGRHEQVTLALNGAALVTAPSVISAAGGTFTARFKLPSYLVSGAVTVRARGKQTRRSAVATLIGGTPVAAQFYFAGGLSTTRERSFVQLRNPNQQPVRVRLTFYSSTGATRTMTGVMRPTSQTVIPVAGIGRVTGTFGLYVKANRAFSAQLHVTRAGKDNATLLGATGLGMTWNLAAGYTGLSVQDRVSILNPTGKMARVQLRLLPLGGQRGKTVLVRVPAHTNTVVDINRLLPRQTLSIIASADHPVLVERTLTFSSKG
ncbi:MAG TPA: hypothetical protein VJY65_13100, partial [Chloroflexota bacterium]|nr:hypothetical protein [Chloroflexota bacterium]